MNAKQTIFDYLEYLISWHFQINYYKLFSAQVCGEHKSQLHVSLADFVQLTSLSHVSLLFRWSVSLAQCVCVCVKVAVCVYVKCEALWLVFTPHCLTGLKIPGEKAVDSTHTIHKERVR